MDSNASIKLERMYGAAKVKRKSALILSRIHSSIVNQLICLLICVVKVIWEYFKSMLGRWSSVLVKVI